MKTIVVSGINLYTGGTLKVMQDCLESLSSYASDHYRIIALVHKTNLYPQYKNVEYIDFPRSRKSWFYKLYYEYIGFYLFSRKLNPYCWLSMHDTTPNVEAERRIVYSHNSLVFYSPGLKELKFQRSIFLISWLSRFIYKINIHKNESVIVQQEWMRKAYQKMFAADNVIVSLPVQQVSEKHCKTETKTYCGNKKLFFYPAGAMVHKNFEIICEAASLLNQEGVTDFLVVLTLCGCENKYARYLYKKYTHLDNLLFIGYLEKDEMICNYRDCDCLLYPSKVESWGLPLTEIKAYDKPVLAADLPYARETIGNYDKVRFFDPDNASDLANCMKAFISGKLEYDANNQVIYKEPFFRNWDELFHHLFEK